MQLIQSYFASITNNQLIFRHKKKPRFSEQNTGFNKFYVTIFPKRER